MGSSPPWRNGGWFMEGYDFFPEPTPRGDLGADSR